MGELDGPAIVAAFAGGVAVGWAVARRAAGTQWAGAIVSLGTLAVLVFWSGQVAAAAARADPGWAESAGHALVQELFVLCAAATAWALWWWDHRRHG